jgi:hypothetical protein
MRAAVLVAAVAVLGASAADAADCAAEIELLRQQYALSPPQAGSRSGAVEAPATTESRGIPPEALSRSGGEIAPPESGGARVIEPPRAEGDPMPTRPPLPPQTHDAPVTGATELSAAKRMQMQALFDAARAAQAQGREAECFERLGDARALAEPG